MNRTILFILSLFLVFSCDPQQRSEQKEDKEAEIEVGDTSPLTRGEIENVIIRSMVNNRLQILLARQAKDKSDNIDFRVFCETLIDHHEEFQYNISQLALTYDIEIPKGLTVKAQNEYDRIDNLSDEEFRREFIDMVIKTHNEDIEHYERLMAEEPDRIERGILETIHDSLNDHLEYAQKMDEEMPESV